MKMLRAVALGLLLFTVTAASCSVRCTESAGETSSRWWEPGKAKPRRASRSKIPISLTAGGTAVMGEDKMGAEEMLSLFYVDGDRLLMTHFCPSGNQPRMQATISPT